jgi:yeast amino acid transporter
VFWRILLFYIVSLTLVGLLVPYTDERLLNGSGSSDAKASPFVISIVNAGISGLPSVMNVVIMIAVLSVGNSSIYGSSRTLAALAEQRQAPHFLAYIDRKGRPLFSILLASAIGYLSYLGASSVQGDAFNWMLALSGLSSIFTWGSICLAHIRFRAGWKHQGHSLDELAFRSQSGYWGSCIGFGFNVLVLIAQFWTGFAPVGYADMTSGELVKNFFQAYLATPIVVLFYVPYKIYFKTPFITVEMMDVKTGRRDLDLDHLLAEERAERASWPAWKKVYKWFC